MQGTRLSRIFSYVVDHDNGYAPNSSGGNCILSHCKYSKTGSRKNLLESIDLGDWIVGTGGNSHKTAPHGTIVCVMCVEKKLPINDLFTDKAFSEKCKDYLPIDGHQHGEWFVASFTEFWHFGHTGQPIPAEFNCFQQPNREPQRLEKKGRGYKCDFSPEFINAFLDWIRHQPHVVDGKPVAQPEAASTKAEKKKCVTKGGCR